MTKGTDRVMATIGYNEVEDYRNYCSIGASEACWRLLQFDITELYPAVTALRIHLPEQQYVIFEEGTESEVAAHPPKQTELTAFFDYNRTHPGTVTKYVDFPREFVFNGTLWKPRQRNKGGMIGRIHTIHPVSGDTFSLCIFSITTTAKVPQEPQGGQWNTL